MKRKIGFSILVLILVSCIAVTAVIRSQGINLEDLNIRGVFFYVYFLYLAQDIYIGDAGLLSGQPCPSPCAFGIHVGETQLEQVIPELGKNGVSRCWTETNLTWSLVSCGGTRFNVQVVTETNLVTAIWFDPSVPISFGDIVEKYGEPNFVTVFQDGPDIIRTVFYWNSIRMSVTLPEISGDTYDVRETREVERIQFSDENLYRISDKESDSYYQPWAGYGVYQPLEPYLIFTTPPATATP